MMLRARQSFAMRFEIRQFQQRIARRFDPDHARFGPQRGFHVVNIRHVDKRERMARAAFADALEQAVRAAIQIVAGNDVRPGIQTLEHRRDRGHARCERIRLRAAFQIGHAALERPARWIVRAPVVESLVHARALLHEG